MGERQSELKRGCGQVGGRDEAQLIFSGFLFNFHSIMCIRNEFQLKLFKQTNGKGEYQKIGVELNLRKI